MLSVRWSAWKVLFSHFSTNSMQARPSHSYFQHILIQKKLHLFCLLICLNVPRWIITNEMFSCGNSLSMACQNDQNASNIFFASIYLQNSSDTPKNVQHSWDDHWYGDIIVFHHSKHIIHQSLKAWKVKRIVSNDIADRARPWTWIHQYGCLRQFYRKKKNHNKNSNYKNYVGRY